MEITTTLSKRAFPGDDARLSTDYVRNRLETGVETVSDLSTDVRCAAKAHAETAIDRGRDKCRKRVDDRRRDGNGHRETEKQEKNCRQREKRAPRLEWAATELLTRLFDPTCDSAVDRAVDEPLDRALASFLHRYDLDPTRIKPEALAAIRTQLAENIGSELEWRARCRPTPLCGTFTPPFGAGR